MKLASCLNIRDKVFILDEPTDGLHLQDIQSLIALLDEMVEQAFDDQCTGANPRYPLMSEIKEMYLKAYYGE